MRPSNCQELIDQRVNYPADHERVVKMVGEKTIHTPVGGTEAIADVLDRSGHSTYKSSREVRMALIGNLGESHIGRKHYDDRGPNYHEFQSVSF